MRHKQRIISISLAALMLISLCAVCATTSVAAKNSPGAPANGLDSGPAVCSWGPGRLDVFAKGTGGDLWHKWWDGNWHSWENLGVPSSGFLTSAPAAVSWGAGRIDVFVKGYGGTLQHKWFDNGWHDWESLGIPRITVNPNDAVFINPLTAPAACSWGSSRLDVFVQGDDGQLWQLWWSASNGWQAWVPLGKPTAGLDGSPGAVSTTSWGYNRIDIFVRGSDGALWQLWWKNGWQAWHRFDDTAGLVALSPYEASGGNTAFGYDAYAPAVCSWGANRLDVFFVDTSGHLQQKWFDPSGWHLNPVGGTKFISAAPSAIVWQSSSLLGGFSVRMDIFARGDDFALWQLYYAELPGLCYNNGILVPCVVGGWYGWYNLGLMWSVD